MIILGNLILILISIVSFYEGETIQGITFLVVIWIACSLSILWKEEKE
ncbi:hypothetical protein GCM10011573_37990 [Enterococcus wangshanyuanii]|uniref:Uncharacterized protein n=1 Tax=Enterococcus wangshanyuanii TaxID=2005703 RepID=A0ABQ1PVW6_9ENTE|nr:hypothetical protein GCM10011573_37990 [Enterococcus wangshanyuanii]